MSEYVLGIDIGGTFTDAVLLELGSGRRQVAKTLTTYPDPSVGVLGGLQGLFERSAADTGDIRRVIHGTTLVTNTLIERKGARTGLITTEGFRDALEIGREGRYDIYDLQLELPEPLVERRHRLTVRERLNPDGSVRTALDPETIDEACEQFRQDGIEAIGICLLHSYVNPEHEQAVRERVIDALPGCAVSISSDVAPELREYERSSTTVANAYVQPLVLRYLETLQSGLQDAGVTADLHVMLSNGGSCSVETACRYPVRLVESGPCGGALAAAECGRRSETNRVLAFDMGGTTAKAIIAEDGHFPVTTESEVARVYRFKRGSGLPLLVPVLDMIEIGAGGGSIAHLNAMGLPAVGPESAGSTPGPACYDREGSRPTVTDADLLLGYLNPEFFLGGEMSLSIDHARQAVESVSGAFGGDVLHTSLGIHQLVNENMANAARVHAAERGVDLRGYALVATGGAGPVHACGVANRLGINRVLVPPIAGVGSAFGLLLAPIAFDYARSYVTRLDDLDVARVSGLLDEMLAAGMETVTQAGVDEDQIESERSVDMRYVGQGHEIRVKASDDVSDDYAVRLGEAFEAEYTRRFGRVCEGVPIEAIHWRVSVSGPSPRYESSPEGGDAGVEVKGTRTVFFRDTGAVDTLVYDRYQLGSDRHSGPAVIEETESTTVCAPGWWFERKDDGSLMLGKEES